MVIFHEFTGAIRSTGSATWLALSSSTCRDRELRPVTLCLNYARPIPKNSLST
jgi:hypothetical protein